MISSSSPFGRRIWRHTTPVTTSERTYGREEQRAQDGPALDASVQQHRQPERERDLKCQRQHDDDDVVPQRGGELGVRESPPEIVEADELVERLETVPVVQAVPHALHDRIDDEDAVEEHRRREEGDDHLPWQTHQRSLAWACGRRDWCWGAHGMVSSQMCGSGGRHSRGVHRYHSSQWQRSLSRPRPLQ